MKYPQDLRRYGTIAMVGGFIILGLFLIKFRNVWRVPVTENGSQLEQSAVDLDALLNFDAQHQPWGSTDDATNDSPLFDLFTPPNIYYDGSQLVMEPCSQWQFDSVFPLRLKTMRPRKYRLQFEGYVKPDQKSKYVIILHDLEHDQVLHCEEGQSFDSLQFRILSFNIKTIEENGMIINSPRVQIFDSAIKQKIELTGDMKYYDDRYDIVLENLDGAVYTMPEIGQEIKIGESTCTLDAIDPNTRSITITLVDANRQKFQRRLRMLLD